MTGAAADYYPIWVIKETTGASFEEIDKSWTLDRINAFMAYMGMKRDYKGVWGEYFQQKAANERSNEA